MSKYKAVVLYQINVYDVLPSGECSGRVLPDKELKSEGIPRSSSITISGNTKEECLLNVRNFISRMKNEGI